MTWYNEFQVWLTEEQSLHNAQLVVNHFANTDWSREAIAALLGNMRHESSVNPDMYEYGYDWTEDRGYGLVQWTPRSKYWDWAVANNLDPRLGESQLARIDYEVENNLQWIAIPEYGNMSFADFRQNTGGWSVAYLTQAFTWSYERPEQSAGESSMPTRTAFALTAFNELDWSGTGVIYPALPVKPGTPITDSYGPRINPVTGEPELHNGTDWGGQLNDEVFAVMAGEVVTVAANDEFRGNWIMIKHVVDNLYSKYLHLNSTDVQLGQQVVRGQRIGFMGTTGQSTGVHLHLTVSTTPEGERDGGEYMDPEVYLATAISEGGGGTPSTPRQPTGVVVQPVPPQYEYEKEVDGNMYYKVKPGDNLSSIASKNNVNMNDIVRVEYSQIQNKNIIHPGEVLLLPKPTKKPPQEYKVTVKAGENLTTIARREGTTVQRLVEINRIKNPDVIHPGQILVVRR